jgi:hypothetical protein
MSSIQEEAQKRARATIENSWRKIAETYTVAWMGAIEAVEVTFDHIRDAIGDIRRNVSRDLPSIIYQTRASPPENMSVAVPYILGRDPYKCRVVSTNALTNDERLLLGEFAQALWFMIDSKILPSPRRGKAFEERLVELTGQHLIRL